MSAAQIEIFKNLVQLGLFDNRNPLYLHQARMLKSALNGKNCVVTAGTGRVKQNHFCSRYSHNWQKKFHHGMCLEKYPSLE